MSRFRVVCAVVAVLAIAAGPAAARKQGDLNPTANNNVFADDLLLLIRQQLGLETFTPEQLEAADVAPQRFGLPTGDGLVNEGDLLILMRYVSQHADVDRDGLLFESQTEPFESDSDGDGLCDGANVVQGQVVLCHGEATLGSDPTKIDTDSDGRCDGFITVPPCVGAERTLGWSPITRDSDGDGLDDVVEDPNLNGWDQGVETNALNADTDGDGLCDGKRRQAWNASGNVVCDKGSEYWEDRYSPGMGSPGNPLVADAEGVLDDLACPHCFAVVVVPDTQYYATHPAAPLYASDHLRQVMDYICAHQTSWREPSTKKVMPIRMVVQLGDLIDGGSDLDAQWQRIDAAFDRLDSCGVPYVVAPGNHDVEPVPNEPTQVSYSLERYSRYFAAPCEPVDMNTDACTAFPEDPMVREGWAEHRCDDPFDCEWAVNQQTGEVTGEWFVGVGHDVEEDTNLPGRPANDEPGRHRAAVIQAPKDPNIQNDPDRRFLFIGLDYAPGQGAGTKDDLAWVESLMNAYPGVPTLLFHHLWFHDGDDGDIPGGTPWNRLVVNHPQVFMTLNGHWGHAIPRDEAEPNGVIRLFRDFQWVPPFGAGMPIYGDGWQVVLVFDPDEGEIRTRSYRIAGKENYRSLWMFQHVSNSIQVNRTHESSAALEETRLLDMDYGCPHALGPLPPGNHEDACERIFTPAFLQP